MSTFPKRAAGWLIGFLLISAGFLLPEPAAGQTKPASEKDEPTADQIVEMVPLNRTLNQGQVLRGTLTKNDLEVPFAMTLQKDFVRFSFEKPKQQINLHIRDKGADLTEVTAGSNKPVPPSRYGEGIRGTDLTYDDISFRYLYWPKREKQPNLDTVKFRKCWVVDLFAPQRVGEYRSVRIFVDREGGALMKMQGYDWEGHLIKELIVTSGMKVDGAKVLKSMDVIRYSPGPQKVVGETSFDLQKPK